MNKRRWRGLRVVILGGARQGLALARYLAEKGAQVIITDLKTDEEMREAKEKLGAYPIHWVLGSHPQSLLNDADALAVSGGVPLTIPLVQEAVDRGLRLINDSQVFMEEVPCQVIGVTGSAGKSTTTALLGRMVADEIGSERTWVGGNIGNPLITQVDKMDSEDLAVVELSSFQLELMSSMPSVAGVLNITPNHLDRHGTMAAYTAAKARIIGQQRSTDTAILNRDDPGSWNLLGLVQGKLISFGKEYPGSKSVGVYLDQGSVYFQDENQQTALFSREEIELLGQHNLMNVLAACAFGWGAGISPEAMRVGVKGFQGMEHRLEFVREWKGTYWYNDSIATTPERSLAAMKSFSAPIILLAGGQDKDLPWDEFAEYVIDHVHQLILFGEAAEVIDYALREVYPQPDQKLEITRCRGLRQAVKAAAQKAQPGDVVLLSPGGTSFDEFEDFTERGNYFKHWAQKLL